MLTLCNLLHALNLGSQNNQSKYAEVCYSPFLVDSFSIGFPGYLEFCFFLTLVEVRCAFWYHIIYKETLFKWM